MSSLRDKLRAAKAMQAELETATNEAVSSLKAKVEDAPAVDSLPTGPAQVGNNQESPLAKLRAKQQKSLDAMANPQENAAAAIPLESARRAGSLARPKESTQAAQSLAQAEAPAPCQPSLAARVAAERAEARRKLDEQREQTAHDSAAWQTEKLAQVAQPQKPERKLSLKEKLAAKKAKQVEAAEPLPAPSEMALRPAKSLEEAKRPIDEFLTPVNQEPATTESGSLRPALEEAAKEQVEPTPVKTTGRILAERKAKAEQEAAYKQKLIRREPPEHTPPTAKPEPTEKPMTALERIRARKLQAQEQKALDQPKPAPSVEAQAQEFMATKLPTGNAQVRVEETGIQGAPQVKAIEQAAQDAKPANRQAVKLNAKQLETVDRFVYQEQSCVMIGAAGTGKTTGVRGVLHALIKENKIRYDADFKQQNGGGLKSRVKDQPNVAICAFTKRAVTNIMESVTSQEGLEVFKWSCQSIHNLLEYAPEYYDVYDDETGEFKQKMRFVPHRTSANPLDVEWLILEEASMVGLDLWEQLFDAMKPGTKVLFLGDINQLPPVFGLPILVYAMLRLPVIELTEVYRQAVGPVLRNAHNILRGKMLVEEAQDDGQAFICYEEYKNAKGGSGLKRHVDDKGDPIMLGEHKLSRIYTTLFQKLYEAGRYNPDEDMIISPFNVGDLGTIHMNQCLAQFIGDARNAVVHEVIAGFNKVYLAVDDKVMVEKQDGVITAIHHNTDYMGSLPKPAGTDLSRFGVRIIGKGGAEEIDLDESADVNFDLDKIGDKTAEELKRAASHVVEVTLESGEVVVLSSSGQFAPEKFTLGYCITGHKAQGSEWRNVYVLMHKKHHSLLTREWLYTVVTRARTQCTLMCKPYSIEQALKNQRIAGDTMQDKLAWFTSGAVDNLDEVELVK